MITVTTAAHAKITEILAEESNAALKLRAFVQGGGCSGFSYGFTLDDTSAEDDYVVVCEGVGSNIEVIVDSISMTYLSGSSIDWVDELWGSNFVISNPNAITTCGCGSSFSM
jgi:iron-sulfur cluster insertion protein